MCVCECVGSVCDLGFSKESSCAKEFSRAQSTGSGEESPKKPRVTHLFFWRGRTHSSCVGVVAHLLLTDHVGSDAEGISCLQSDGTETYVPENSDSGLLNGVER